MATLITFNEVVDFLPPSSGGSVQLEGPKEVTGVLEIGSNGHDLVDQVLDTDQTVLAKGSLHDVVGSHRGTFALDLKEYFIRSELHPINIFNFF